MLRHLGYSAETQSSIDLAPYRPLRISEANPDRIREMIRDNLQELARVLHYNVAHGLLFHRVSSQVIPFAAHPETTIAWWDEFAAELASIGQFARRAGLRLEMNPGRHSLLNSPSPETVALSILELGWHVRFFNAMQLDTSHKLVLRVGVTFGERSSSLARFVAVVNGLPTDWKSRLVIENTDAHYSLPEVLESSERTSLPVVVSCSTPFKDLRDPQTLSGWIAQSFQSWNQRDGVPIIHLGDSTRIREGIESGDFETILGLMPMEPPFDCLVESTQGDRSLFDLLERMANRESVPLSVSIDLSSTMGRVSPS